MDPEQRHSQALEALRLDVDPDTRRAVIVALVDGAMKQLHAAAYTLAFAAADDIGEDVRQALRVADLAATLYAPDPAKFWATADGATIEATVRPLLAALAPSPLAVVS